MAVDNLRTVGNIFPNYLTDRKHSLNLNRNGYMGDFPHDYFDIYIDHVAKYAYNIDVPQIKEYYPLKRAIQYKNNLEYFRTFNSFDDFLRSNYLTEIWEISRKKIFSDMDFIEFKNISSYLIKKRGLKMLEQLIKVNTEDTY